MPSTGLSGPYTLTSENIDLFVSVLSPGAYALGRTDANGVFNVEYVGRSDTDLNSRLKNWVGKYNQLKYGYFSPALAAFEKECHLYHDFGGDKGSLNNDIHPQRPQGSNWTCPVCSIFPRVYY